MFLPFYPVHEEERAQDPGAYLLTFEEAKALNIAGAYYTVSDIRLRPQGAQTTDDSKLKKALQDSLERNGISILQLQEICRKAANGKAWAYSPSIDDALTDAQEVVYFTTDNATEGRILRAEKPEFWEEGKTARERAALCNIATNTPLIFDTELKIAQAIEKIFQWGIKSHLPALSPTPSSFAFNLVSRLMNSGKQELDLRAITNTREELTFTKGNLNDWTITSKTKNSTAKITIRDYYKFIEPAVENQTKAGRKGAVSMRGTKKIMRFLLTLIMRQSGGYKLPDYIDIDLEEMVNKKMYATIDTAWRGLDAAFTKISLMHIWQEFTSAEKDSETGKKKKYMGGGPLFTYIERPSHKRARIFLQERFSYEFFKNYTYFPSWGFALNDSAFSLLDYVCYLIRQRGGEIKTKGYLAIKLQTIAEQIGLKTVDEVRENHQRKYAYYIKAPITEAIQEINKTAKADKTINGAFVIKMHTPDVKDINDWLNGEIRIYAKGEYTDRAITIAETHQTMIDEWNEKKEKNKKQPRKERTKGE